ncbi:MAG: MFS transporter [Woeseiaceae bacterium]|nr:MFS transporter [Woeseiaceae bacterium]
MSRILLILTLIVSGEMVFGLPFHTNRYFRGTFLEVFGFTNTQLGDVFAVYGVLAMLCYFPGGALADRFSARTLLTASLVATAIGGLYMATIPGVLGMAVLYGFFGISTIFLFWGALIRAARDWGGASEQGMAFGLLEAGRGLVAASVAVGAAVMFAALMPENVEQATDAERRAAFQAVILAYVAVALIAAAMCWFILEEPDARAPRPRDPFRGMATVIGRPVIWAQASIIICAYCAFKGFDNYGLYAQQVLGMNEAEANKATAWGSYIRPVAAIAAGLIADRFNAARSILVVFGVLIVTYLPLSMLGAGSTFLILTNASITLIAVFALRAVYFALLEENRTPVWYTGAATGMVSFIGFSPEIFFGPITGRILDASPGIEGFHNYFLFLAGVAAAGMLCVFWLLWLRSRGEETLWPRVLASETKS